MQFTIGFLLKLFFSQIIDYRDFLSKLNKEQQLLDLQQI